MINTDPNSIFEARRMSAATADYVISPYVVVIDTQEQMPFGFTGYTSKKRPFVIRTVSEKLKTGDYSLVGYEDRLSVERKNPADAYQTICHERDRFERELIRLDAMDFAAVIVESSWPQLMSRICHMCDGNGFTVPVDEQFTINMTGRDLVSFGRDYCHSLFRAVQQQIPRQVKCETCDGTGRLHPMQHSKFNPNSFEGSVFAWQARFPKIHWWFAETRSRAERVTLKWLEMFWRYEQAKLKAKEGGN